MCFVVKGVILLIFVVKISIFLGVIEYIVIEMCLIKILVFNICCFDGIRFVNFFISIFCMFIVERDELNVFVIIFFFYIVKFIVYGKRG